MDTIFLQIINMSMTASYVILFVILLRLLLRKVPRVYSYSLWIVVLFRLLLPFSFSSVFSMVPINTKAILADIIDAPTPEIHRGIAVAHRVANRSLPAPVVVASINPIEIGILIGQILWVTGVAALLIYSLISTMKLAKKLIPTNHFRDNIYEVNHIETPFVFGILRPRIYIPFGLSKKEKSYIIKHEETHIKRLDHIIKPVSFIAASIHWFNPLVWVAFFLMSKDMELSCDEKVISEMGNEIKKDYSHSLLSLSSSRTMIGGSPLAFGGENTKGRIKNILNYTKPRFSASLVGGMVIVLAIIGLLSNPKEQVTQEPVDGQTSIAESRHYKLEDIAESQAEETVLNNFKYTLNADFKGLSETLADTNTHRISIENEEKQYHEGVYIESYIVHEISTLTKSEYSLDQASPLYYDGWQELVERYNLIEYEIVNVNFTQKHSEKSLESGPQWGDGTYYRSFLVGKSSKDHDYRIYDFGMM